MTWGENSSMAVKSRGSIAIIKKDLYKRKTLSPTLSSKILFLRKRKHFEKKQKQIAV